MRAPTYSAPRMQNYGAPAKRPRDEGPGRQRSADAKHGCLARRPERTRGTRPVANTGHGANMGNVRSFGNTGVGGANHALAGTAGSHTNNISNLNRTHFVSNGTNINGNRGFGNFGRNPYRGYHRGWYNGNWGGFGGFGYPFGYGFGGLGFGLGYGLGLGYGGYGGYGYGGYGGGYGGYGGRLLPAELALRFGAVWIWLLAVQQPLLRCVRRGGLGCRTTIRSRSTP